jgi:pantetheine-phosphate adenylyltransferase
MPAGRWRSAVYPGTFDPFTSGHLDVLERAAQLFDRVIVGVAANPEKRVPLFGVEERVEMIREAAAHLREVTVTSYAGLTVDFAQSEGAQALVRGLRAYADFDAEQQQALMNRQLAPDVHTVFLMSKPDHIFVSSTILKDVASRGRDVSEFVPPVIAERLRVKFG